METVKNFAFSTGSQKSGRFPQGNLPAAFFRKNPKSLGIPKITLTGFHWDWRGKVEEKFVKDRLASGTGGLSPPSAVKNLAPFYKIGQKAGKPEKKRIFYGNQGIGYQFPFPGNTDHKSFTNDMEVLCWERLKSVG